MEFKDASEEQRNITEVNPGIYMFNVNWLWQNIDRIKNQNMQNEYYLTDIAEVAIQTGEKIFSQQIAAEEVLGVNSPQDLQVAEDLLKQQ